MPEIMTTKELAKYLKLHEITICKYAAEGKIPAIRIGRVWRFDKEAIDRWISGGQKKQGRDLHTPYCLMDCASPKVTGLFMNRGGMAFSTRERIRDQRGISL